VGYGGGGATTAPQDRKKGRGTGGGSEVLQPSVQTAPILGRLFRTQGQMGKRHKDNPKQQHTQRRKQGLPRRPRYLKPGEREGWEERLAAEVKNGKTPTQDPRDTKKTHQERDTNWGRVEEAEAGCPGSLATQARTARSTPPHHRCTELQLQGCRTATGGGQPQRGRVIQPRGP